MSSGRTSFGQPGAHAAAEESGAAKPCAFGAVCAHEVSGAFEGLETLEISEAVEASATPEGSGWFEAFDMSSEADAADRSDETDITTPPIAPAAKDQADANFSYLFRRLVRLYAAGSGSVSRAEAASLLESLSFTLGIENLDEPEAIALLADRDSDVLFHEKLSDLTRRVDAALETWREICAAMPPIRNVALRDTLESIGAIKALYDTYFAAHEVPCDVQYQLSRPVDERLRGIDYVQAWLDQLLCETRWIAQFTPESCIASLERACPDYRGLHVNLYDLLAPREGELVRKGV